MAQHFSIQFWHNFRSYENDQENKYEWVRRLDARMKVMNECQIGLCWGILESLGGQLLVIFLTDIFKFYS